MEFSSVLLAALGIGLLIFLHELGHFAAARAAGVQVDVFSIGFGPRLFGVVVGNTDFRLSLVPFGGYVMVAGQDPADDRYPPAKCLWAKSVGQRTLFWSGGVLMNLLFALVVFPLVFHAGVSFSAPVVGGVQPGSPAWEAELAPGDRILAVAGKPMYSFENLGIEVALHGPRPLELQVRGQDGGERAVRVTPRYSAADGLSTLGIAAATAPDLPRLSVAKDGPAAAAGLRDGDELLAIGGVPTTAPELTDAVQALAAAQDRPIEVRVRRDGQELAVDVAGRNSGEFSPWRLGVEPLPRQVVGLRPGSALLDALAVQRGDVLLAVDGQPFVSGDLAGALQGDGPLRLLVLRDGARRELTASGDPAARSAAAAHLALGPDDSMMLLPRPDSPAAQQGLRPGDRLLAVGDRQRPAWEEFRTAVERSNGQPLALVVDRQPATVAPENWRDTVGGLPTGERVDLRLRPERLAIFDHGFVPELRMLREEVRATDFADALRLGTVCSLDMIKQLYVTLKRLVTGEVGAKNLSGIIGISKVSYQAAQRGMSWFWYFLALLSLNLAFVNLLPIPALDGGHLLFLAIERIKGSPVSTRVLGYSQVLGLVFVLLLVLFVTYNDIVRLL
jgi:regulator of sigma E protease